MITFTILALMVVMLLVAAVAILSVGGTVFTIVFGDLILCVIFIVLFMKFLFNRKKKRR